MAVIEIEALRKRYRRLRGGATIAVDGLDLSVPEGGVYGFLGPNGAGKTTTIRCMLGLVRPSGGRCAVFGQDTGRHLAKVMPRIGSIVETPAFTPRFTGRRNLEVLGRIDGFGPKAVADVLARVDLAERADSLVKSYSLGMKQRLGLAAALLKDPALLVLDEPANGLDPAGIREIRELMRSLSAEGRTVFVSSHILAEVQHVADSVAILAKGRCVKAGPVGEVLASGKAESMLLRLPDPAAGVQVLREAGVRADVEGDLVRVQLPPSEGSQITRTLAGRGLFLSELRPDEADLETVFLQLTGEAPEAGGIPPAAPPSSDLPAAPPPPPDGAVP